MTQPYYTATQGPADPVAPAAAKLYTVVSGILGLVGIASTFGLVTQEQGASLGAVGTAATTLVGAVVTAIASFRTNKQLKNGTFEAAPVTPPSPALDAVTGMQAVATQFNDLTTSVAAGLDLVQRTAAQVPGLGGLVATGGGLVDQVLEMTRQRDAAVQTADRRQQPRP